MIAQLLAAAGVLCVLAALVALAGIWWAVLVLGFVLLAASWSAHTSSTAPAAAPAAGGGS